MLVRTQGNFPRRGGARPYTIGHLVAASCGEATTVRSSGASEYGVSFFDGPPIVSALAFCVKDGRFTEPADAFDHRTGSTSGGGVAKSESFAGRGSSDRDAAVQRARIRRDCGADEGDGIEVPRARRKEPVEA